MPTYWVVTRSSSYNRTLTKGGNVAVNDEQRARRVAMILHQKDGVPRHIFKVDIEEEK